MIITLLLDSKKKEGVVKHLRFRLRDTGVDIKYRSDISATIEDLKMFDSSGRPVAKARFGNYNHDLAEQIEIQIQEMSDAYEKITREGIRLTYDSLRAKIEEGHTDSSPYTNGTWLDAWDYYTEYKYSHGYITYKYYKLLTSVGSRLQRFAKIFHYTDYRVQDITPAIISKHYEFLQNEYAYAKVYKTLYENVHKPPTKPRKANTMAGYNKRLCVFFSNMVEQGIIKESPFKGVLREERATMLREQYDAPVFLRAEEYIKVRDFSLTDERLIKVRKMFLLQCTLGCRMSDFIQISRDKICVNREGVAFFRYVPRKTSGVSREDVETPLLKSSVDTLKELDFYIFNDDSKKKLKYNKGIRDLLKVCGIDRPCKVWNEQERQNKLVPLYEFGGSKLCRKTHEDMMVKVQLNMYTTGLHAVGSQAIKAYTSLELIDRLRMMCLAFGEPVCLYDDNLNEKDADTSRADILDSSN